MSKLSEHFTATEFERDGDAIPQDAVPCFERFCADVLEPLRAAFGEPFWITSGYRSAAANARVGGVPDSQHVAAAEHCAADGYFASRRKDMRPVFDWLRGSRLPFDQAILEHGKNGDIIHLSYRTEPRREALEGATFNRTGYTTWPVSA